MNAKHTIFHCIAYPGSAYFQSIIRNVWFYSAALTASAPAVTRTWFHVIVSSLWCQGCSLAAQLWPIKAIGKNATERYVWGLDSRAAETAHPSLSTPLRQIKPHRFHIHVSTHTVGALTHGYSFTTDCKHAVNEIGTNHQITQTHIQPGCNAEEHRNARSYTVSTGPHIETCS